MFHAVWEITRKMLENTLFYRFLLLKNFIVWEQDE